MNEEQKKQILKQIEICKQTAQNNFELNCESYVEINNALYYMTQLLIHDDKK